jgi:hypothetical protein
MSFRPEPDPERSGDGGVEEYAVFRGYLLAGCLFCPRLLTDSLPFAALRPGFFRHSGGSSSPSTGAFPFPARSRMRKVSERSARLPLSRKYSSVRKAETFSATATLMSWFNATPSSSAAFLNSSRSEGCSRNAKLLRLIGSTPDPHHSSIKLPLFVIPTGARAPATAQRRNLLFFAPETNA